MRNRIKQGKIIHTSWNVMSKNLDENHEWSLGRGEKKLSQLSSEVQGLIDWIAHFLLKIYESCWTSIDSSQNVNDAIKNVYYSWVNLVEWSSTPNQLSNLKNISKYQTRYTQLYAFTLEVVKSGRDIYDESTETELLRVTTTLLKCHIDRVSIRHCTMNPNLLLTNTLTRST